MAASDDLKRAAELIAGASRLVVSSGAGMSKESGVPTFRDALEGLWAKFDPEQLATPQAFKNNPDTVWSWYMHRHNQLKQVQPNPGHLALAQLEDVLPQVAILTQNVDGLHQRAGSTDVIELHGSLARFRCFDSCQGQPTHIDLDSLAYDESAAPACPHCGEGLVRPDVVWFGEMLPAQALERAFREAQNCDLMLVVGTSGVVQPAASLPIYASDAGAPVIEINPTPSELTPQVDVFLAGPAGQILPELVSWVYALRSS